MQPNIDGLKANEITPSLAYPPYHRLPREYSLHNSLQVPPGDDLSRRMSLPAIRLTVPYILPSINNSEASTNVVSNKLESKESHKLAERRRRKELKDLFDELRMSTPSLQMHTRASKWEILTSASQHILVLEKEKQILLSQKEFLSQKLAMSR